SLSLPFSLLHLSFSLSSISLSLPPPSLFLSLLHLSFSLSSLSLLSILCSSFCEVSSRDLILKCGSNSYSFLALQLCVSLRLLGPLLCSRECVCVCVCVCV